MMSETKIIAVLSDIRDSLREINCELRAIRAVNRRVPDVIFGEYEAKLADAWNDLSVPASRIAVLQRQANEAREEHLANAKRKRERELYLKRIRK